jgi:purine-nucleoside phosphorylase
MTQRASDRAAAAAQSLAAATGVGRHDVAVVLGSGWPAAADAIGAPTAVIDAASLPGFPVPTVEGHGGTIRSIEVHGRHILVLLGRVHAYEGHDLDVVVHGVRTAVAAGCSTIVLTNAAGGLRDDLVIGQPVLIADHLNLTGRSVLEGPNDDRLGPRFPDMTNVYTDTLRARTRVLEPSLVEGVYAGVAGPQYETPAEIKMFRSLGADLVGMSTVHEATAAAHCGAAVLGISLVTNLAAGMGATLDHHDVLEVAAASAESMGTLLARLVSDL